MRKTVVGANQTSASPTDEYVEGGVVQADADGSDSSERQPAETDARPERALQARVLGAHQRLLAGDPVASADLYELLLVPVVRALRRRWPDASWEEAVEDAAIDALVQHIRAAERYDPARASLLGWLVWQANADLINVYRSAQRQFERNVEIQSQLRNDSDDAEQSLDTMGGASDRYPVLENTGMWARIRAAFPDRRERELIWRCWVEGERSTEVAAAILGFTGLPAAEQQQQVKNVKDRIKKKLQRMGLADEQD
jgi:DNA-directed RNA polymerase specialized sigma24 family protein